jgi:excisionase family DNA binding protein
MSHVQSDVPDREDPHDPDARGSQRADAALQRADGLMPSKTAAAPKKLMVSPQEAADMLSVDRDTVFRWIKEGKLAASKLSPRIVRIRVADIDAMIARGVQ